MKAQKRIWWGLLALMQATAGRLYGLCVKKCHISRRDSPCGCPSICLI